MSQSSSSSSLRTGCWTLNDALASLPLPATAKWPQGVFDRAVWDARGVSLSIFAPRGIDHQTAHAQDEIYVVVRGSAVLDLDGTPHPVAPGDAVYVAAGVPHQFERIAGDFATWVIFFPGAEAPSDEGVVA